MRCALVLALLPFAWGKIDTCKLCKLGVGIARKTPAVFQRHLELPIVVAIAREVCKKVNGTGECNPSKHSADPNFKPCVDLCHGMMQEEGAVIFELMSEKDLSDDEICGGITGVCPPPPVVQPDLTLPPIKRSDLANTKGEGKFPRWTNRKLRTKSFLHISDVHLQLDYKVGNEANCGEPICCRTEVGKAQSPKTAAGVFGADGCDYPLTVFEAMLDHAKLQNPDFVLQTGDDPAHDVWHQSEAANTKALQTLAGGLAKRFTDVPVVNAFGNHGAFPVDQYRGPGGDDWLYSAAAKAWAPLPDDAESTVAYGGFYQMRVLPKLRALVLHSTMWESGNNWFFVARPKDIARQLAWCKDVLVQARARKEKVLWLMHHPGGAAFGDTIQGLIREFDDIVVASFVGHAHSTWFDVTEPDAKTTGNVEYCTGGDMGAGLNPTYRIFHYEVDEEDNFVKLTDFDQYYLDFDKANVAKKAVFEKLHSASTAYGLKDLTAPEWRKLAQSWVDGGAEAEATHGKYANYGSRLKKPGDVSPKARKSDGCGALYPFDKEKKKQCLHKAGVEGECKVPLYDPSMEETMPRGLPMDQPKLYSAPLSAAERTIVV